MKVRRLGTAKARRDPRRRSRLSSCLKAALWSFRWCWSTPAPFSESLRGEFGKDAPGYEAELSRDLA